MPTALAGRATSSADRSELGWDQSMRRSLLNRPRKFQSITHRFPSPRNLGPKSSQGQWISRNSFLRTGKHPFENPLVDAVTSQQHGHEERVGKDQEPILLGVGQDQLANGLLVSAAPRPREVAHHAQERNG